MEKDSKSALTEPPRSGPSLASVASLKERLKKKTSEDATLIQQQAESEQQQLGLALKDLSQNALTTTNTVIAGQLEALTSGLASNTGKIAEALTETSETLTGKAAEMKSSLTGPQNSVRALMKEAQTDREQAKSELATARMRSYWILGAAVLLALVMVVATWLGTESALLSAQTENRDWGNGKTYTLILSPGWTTCKPVDPGPVYPCILKK